jgi:signal transduction histidine kinase
MGLKSRISRLRLNAKLLLVNIIVALAFGLVAFIVVLSFHHIKSMASEVALEDLRSVAANARASHQVTALFTEVTQLAYTFYGDNQLLSQQRASIGQFMNTLASAAEPSMQLVLDALQTQLSSFFEQCGAVNGALLSWGVIDNRLNTALEKLHLTMTEVAQEMHRQGKDPTIVDRFAGMSASLRENLMELEKTFATLPRMHYAAPLQENRSPLLDILDSLEFKLQVLPTYRQDMIREIKNLRIVLQDARQIVLVYYRTMANLHERLAQLNEAKTGVMAALEAENREVALAAQQIPERIASQILSTAVVFLTLSALVLALLMFIIARLVRRNVQAPLKQILTALEGFGKGRKDLRVTLGREDDWAEVETNINRVFESLRGQDWLSTGKALLSDRLRGNQRTRDMAPACVSFFAKRLGAQVGALYLAEDQYRLLRRGGYGLADPEAAFASFALGEGFVGQAAIEDRILVCSAGQYDAPKVDFGIGRTEALHCVAAPFSADGRLVGVLLLGADKPFSPLKLSMLEQSMESLAVAFISSMARRQIADLLEKTQRQAFVLSEQQEELRNTNQELAEQTRFLRQSEMSLQAQQEELRVANEELATQASALRESELRLQTQQEELRVANKELNELNSRLEAKVALRTSDLAKKADELEAVNQRLLELDQLKSAFLSSVSHELRTPLTSVLGFAKLIRRDLDKSFWPLADGDKRLERRRTTIKNNLGIIEHEGERLSRLINDVLDLNKIESGRMDWRDAVVDVGEALTHVVNSVASQLANKPEVELKLNVDEELPSLWVDPDRLEQVLVNLIGNAIKFTNAGHVAVRSFVASNGWVQIEVEDTGSGIPEEDLDKVFDKFHQVRAQDTLREKPAGTGLGLAICREILDHYRGRIWVRSKLGVGSIFFLQFGPHKILSETSAHPEPLLRATGAAKSAASKEADTIPSEDAQAPLALVIEDEPPINELIRQLLEAEGFRVAGAYSAEEGLQLAKELKPSCVTMDLMLPGLDGKTAIGLFKEDPELAQIPILVVSALSDRDAAGGDAALGKPIDEEKLVASVRSLIEKNPLHGPVVMLRRKEPNGGEERYVCGGAFVDCSQEELWRRIESGFTGTVVIPADAIPSFDLSRLGGKPGVQIVVVP